MKKNTFRLSLILIFICSLNALSDDLHRLSDYDDTITHCQMSIVFWREPFVSINKAIVDEDFNEGKNNASIYSFVMPRITALMSKKGVSTPCAKDTVTNSSIMRYDQLKDKEALSGWYYYHPEAGKKVLLKHSNPDYILFVSSFRIYNWVAHSCYTGGGCSNTDYFTIQCRYLLWDNKLAQPVCTSIIKGENSFGDLEASDVEDAIEEAVDALFDASPFDN
jgi:hypothetical protein